MGGAVGSLPTGEVTQMHNNALQATGRQRRALQSHRWPAPERGRWATQSGGLMSKVRSLLFVLLSATSFSAASSTMCPDGQFHADGQCKLCPDGSWTTAPRCALAPDGNYVPDYGGGTRLAPDGRYIPNTGSMILCPDGNYYPGRSCRLLPDGRYVGAQ